VLPDFLFAILLGKQLSPVRLVGLFQLNLENISFDVPFATASLHWLKESSLFCVCFFFFISKRSEGERREKKKKKKISWSDTSQTGTVPFKPARIDVGVMLTSTSVFLMLLGMLKVIVTALLV
jgi:hypothetical protein